jgi:hypothetical protein
MLGTPLQGLPPGPEVLHVLIVAVPSEGSGEATTYRAEATERVEAIDRHGRTVKLRQFRITATSKESAP